MVPVLPVRSFNSLPSLNGIQHICTVVNLPAINEQAKRAVKIVKEGCEDSQRSNKDSQRSTEELL